LTVPQEFLRHGWRKDCDACDLARDRALRRARLLERVFVVPGYYTCCKKQTHPPCIPL